MARKTAKQKEAQAQVEQRLTGEGPVRLDASAVKSGRSGGALEATRTTINEIHPSVEGATQRLEGAGLAGGTVTTSSGLSVRVSRSNANKAAGFNPQAASAQEGVSQRFEQRIGYEHGPEAAAKHVAEAEKIAARPNPLRSDGLVDAVMALHSPSVGGNRLGHGGRMSALARMDDQFKPSSKIESGPLTISAVSDVARPASQRGVSPSTAKLVGQDAYATSGRDLALHTLGYTPRVQQTMLSTARDRIARRSANGDPRNRLSDIQIKSRAYEQVNEHLDAAIHGTRESGSEPRQINDIQAGGTWIESIAGAGTPAPPTGSQKGGGLGMTAKRTPEQRAQRATVRDLTRGGKWNGLRDADALEQAVKNDVDLLTAKQKARRASGKHPEEFNTMSPGADVAKAQRRHTQLPFSTNNPGQSLPQSYGPASMEGDQSVITRETGKVLPPKPRVGAVSPVPPNLPMEPAKIGRTREERGIKPSSFPTGSEPVVAAKPGKMRPVRKVAAGGSGTGIDQGGRWSPSQGLAAQTEQPRQFAGTGIDVGLHQARAQNVQLGQRAASGPRMAYKATP